MKCPDCDREKAKNANDAIKGFCPKWWAITDKMADEDCETFKKKNEEESINKQLEFVEWLKSEERTACFRVPADCKECNHKKDCRIFNISKAIMKNEDKS